MCSVIYPLKNKRRNVCASRGGGMTGSLKEKLDSDGIAERRYVRHERRYGEKIQKKSGI